MNEINNNANKDKQLIEEILKKSSSENKNNDTTYDTMPVKHDAKAIVAKPILKEISFYVVGNKVKKIIKKKRLFSFANLIFYFVFLPTLITFLYLVFWASPMYISNMKFSVQNTKPSISGLDLASLMGGGIGRGAHENYVVLEFLQSLSLINEVDKELHIKDHYSSHDYDFISRLTSHPTTNELLKYWNFAVTSSLDVEGGIIDVDVKAYTPEMAQNISKKLLAKSELLVNELNKRLQQDSIKLAEEEVKIAIAKVNNLQNKMRKFREKHSTFDPELTATGMQTRIEALQGEYTKLQTELNMALSIMSPNAPQVKNLKSSLAAVKKQLDVENAKVASSKSDTKTLSSVVAEYEALTMDLKFAKEQQVMAMKAFETARVQGHAQTSYLVCIQEPTLPDESLYPRVFLFTFYTFCGTLLGLGLISLVVAAVREHTGF